MNDFARTTVLKAGAALAGVLATLATIRWIKLQNKQKTATVVEEQLPKSPNDMKTDTEAHEPWRKWYGKVLGSENDIRNALEELGRSPKNEYELQDIIAERRSVEINKMSEDSLNSFY